MIILLSPAKTFHNISSDELKKYKDLEFGHKTLELITHLQEYDVAQLKTWLNVSDELAQLNYTRYQDFTKDTAVGCEAINYFNGEAYKGLDAHTLNQLEKDYLHQHLLILSGLYGCIAAKDIIQPYRLEMGSKMMWEKDKNLCAYWKKELTGYVLKRLGAAEGEQVLINLASTEYSKSLDLKTISKHFPVIEIEFKTLKNGKYKVVGMYAKKARGLMARFMAQNHIAHSQQLKDFKEEGYRYHKELSTENKWVFVNN